MSCAPSISIGLRDAARDVMRALDQIGDDHVVADALAPVGAQDSRASPLCRPAGGPIHSGPHRWSRYWLRTLWTCTSRPVCDRRAGDADGTPKRMMRSPCGDRARARSCGPAESSSPASDRAAAAVARRLAGRDVAQRDADIVVGASTIMLTSAVMRDLRIDEAGHAASPSSSRAPPRDKRSRTSRVGGRQRLDGRPTSSMHSLSR